jgi:hypothetical protein
MVRNTPLATVGQKKRPVAMGQKAESDGIGRDLLHGANTGGCFQTRRLSAATAWIVSW